jgi:hypothetical protein
MLFDRPPRIRYQDYLREFRASLATTATKTNKGKHAPHVTWKQQNGKNAVFTERGEGVAEEEFANSKAGDKVQTNRKGID